MDFEIEFHPVGDATKAGDAISVRYGYGGLYEIMVVDGGTSDSGAALVDHIRGFYGNQAVITHMVSSHPDTDHASGLREVLNAFPVTNLWIHGVWHHAQEVLPYFADARWTADGLANAIRAEYPIIEEIIDLAHAKGTLVWEPFAGVQIGPFTVLSPTKYAYLRLLPQFRKTPAPNQELLEAERMWVGKRPQGILGLLFEKAAAAVAKWVAESWDIELLREGSITAAENETSTVLHGQFGDRSVLLTADAGVNALSWACDQADALGLDLKSAMVVQVPHHGSRSNVTPSILDRLLGPRLPVGSAHTRNAVVSCPKDDEKHPRKMVVNAFSRRGLRVCKTQGKYYRWYTAGMPFRANEVAATAFNWFDQVEDYD